MFKNELNLCKFVETFKLNCSFNGSSSSSSSFNGKKSTYFFVMFLYLQL